MTEAARECNSSARLSVQPDLVAGKSSEVLVLENASTLTDVAVTEG